MADNHPQRTVNVLVDVDEGVADMVLYLNTIPGVRTHASCQGTIGEGGPNPYRQQVMVTWTDAETFARLQREFDLSDVSHYGNWCYVHPRTVLSGDALKELETWLRDYAATHSGLPQYSQWADALSVLLRERDEAQAMFKDCADSDAHAVG